MKNNILSKYILYMNHVIHEMTVLMVSEVW